MAIIKGEDSDHLELWTELKPVLKRLSTNLGKDVVASNPHGHKSKIEGDDGRLYVKFWSIPPEVDGRKGEIRNYVFGYSLPGGTRDCFVISPEAGNILCSEHDEPVALFYLTTLYVLFDLPHGSSGSSQAPDIMDRIVTEFLEFYEVNHTSDPVEANKTSYAKVCIQALDKQRKLIEKKIKDQQLRGDEIVRALTDHYRQMDSLQLELFNTTQIEARTQHFEQEYDKLLKAPHVKFVKVVGTNTIQVITDTIYLTYDDNEYEIGDFQITFHPGGRLKIVNLRVKELTGQTYIHHPHVFYDDGSNVCMGNIGPGVMKLIAEHEYAMATHVLIRFLCSMTKESQYIDHLRRNFKPLKQPRVAAGGEKG